MMVTRYPMVSLCLDSSAFSCRYSLKSIGVSQLEQVRVVYKAYYDFRIRCSAGRSLYPKFRL
jgi:hypothetical protein